ncbi:hypothetical protein, conserved [Eimeria necatrix]|uniref:IFT52 GIFT domain-containing protein n=1 Tax=Eimeria necatrix TaxID=51315 RepID=U6MII5_9EIME|nr:hypothetical protein, conserved [Eimeria necatrix]CDJ62888.1 hypothetical protein, conserved [Eimeria necatrix]
MLHSHTEQVASSGMLEEPQNRQKQEQQRVVVAFDVSKGEAVDPSDPSFTRCCRLLKQLGCTCVVNKSLLNLAKLERHGVSLLIVGNPSKPFTAEELTCLKLFLQTPQTDAATHSAAVPVGVQCQEPTPMGDAPVTASSDNAAAADTIKMPSQDAAEVETVKSDCSPTEATTKTTTANVRQARSILVLGGSGSSSNVNFLLEEMGLSLAADSVVAVTPPTLQQQQRGVCHPREVVLQQQQLVGASMQHLLQQQQGHTSGSRATFIYPYGSSVYVQHPAVPLLCSSNCCSPSQRPLIAAAAAAGGGFVVVCGSSRLLQDPYLSLYSNTDLVRLLLQLLLGHISLQQLRPTAAEAAAAVRKYIRQTDTEIMSLLPQPCLEAPPDASNDFRSLHQQQSFAVQPRLLKHLQQLLKQVKANPIDKPLEPIKPTLLQPFPTLRPALHPPITPCFRAPSLPLVDLDSLFMSPQQHLLAAAAAALADEQEATANSVCATSEVPSEYFVCRSQASVSAPAKLQQEAPLVNFILRAANVTGILRKEEQQQEHEAHQQQEHETYSHHEYSAGREATAREALARLLGCLLNRRRCDLKQRTGCATESA